MEKGVYRVRRGDGGCLRLEILQGFRFGFMSGLSCVMWAGYMCVGFMVVWDVGRE